MNDNDDIDESDSDFAEHQFEEEGYKEIVDEHLRKPTPEEEKEERDRQAYQRYLYDGGTYADDPRR